MCSKQNGRFKSRPSKSISESKTLSKHVSCEYKCKFDGRKSDSSQKWNNDKCQCENMYMKEIIFEILLHVLPNIVNI